MYSKGKITDYLRKGREVERKFASFFDNVELSTEEEDMKGHFDLSVTSRIDVKGLKKVNRSDDAPDENLHWLEIKNVNGGYGWVYGEADYFAFETIDYFVVVSKEGVQQLLKDLVEKKYTKEPKLYRLYSRKDRKDVLTLVKTIDLIYYSEILVKK
jgi:hypothetical protein